MITGINELKTIKKKHVSGKQAKVNVNSDVSAKFIIYMKKGYIQNSATCSSKIGKYLASIIDYSAITSDETINGEAKSYDEEIKTVTTNFNEKNTICKTKNFYILLAFLLIAIALLIAASVYCYLI